MKYKLIKEYPNSPKLNTIIFRKKRNWYEKDRQYKKHFLAFNDFNPKSYPEYWQEIKDDYKIMKFNDGYNFYTRMLSGYFTINTQYEYTENTLLRRGLKIFSIRREIDNVYFSIGDIFQIKGQTIRNSITNIIIDSSNNLRIYYLNSRIEKKYVRDIDIIEKIEPIIKTKDGINLFENDTYYKISKDYKIEKCIIDKFVIDELIYSDINKAKEYVLLNKPCLSIKDIQSIYVSAKEGYYKNGRYSRENSYYEKLKNIVEKRR